MHAISNASIAATVGVIGTTVTMQAALNASQGYNRGGTKNIKDNSHNERHGDGGRAKTKSEKQIEQLKSQLPDASRKERQKIEQKIKIITQDAKKKESGEEHSRGNKR